MIRTLAIILALSVTPTHAQVLCPVPNVPGAKLDKTEPCATQRDVMRTVDAPKGKPNMRKRVRVK